LCQILIDTRYLHAQDLLSEFTQMNIILVVLQNFLPIDDLFHLRLFGDHTNIDPLREISSLDHFDVNLRGHHMQ
jgi:hypothetical protein